VAIYGRWKPPSALSNDSWAPIFELGQQLNNDAKHL
jgi:hypothetical protein